LEKVFADAIIASSRPDAFGEIVVRIPVKAGHLVSAPKLVTEKSYPLPKE
jgi:hypothetical protein